MSVSAQRDLGWCKGCAEQQLSLIHILSISKNVGALSRYLSHLRTTSRYYDAKENVSSFLDLSLIHI